MPDPLLVTKVSLPILRHILVPVKKVLEQLSEESQGGQLLTPGFAAANDLKQFPTYVLTALQQVGAISGRRSWKSLKTPRKGNRSHKWIPQLNPD
jgi:hypothetical protein